MSSLASLCKAIPYYCPSFATGSKRFERCWFDESNKLLLALLKSSIHRYNFFADQTDDGVLLFDLKDIVTKYSEIELIRLSLDGLILAVQLSSSTVLIIDLGSRTHWIVDVKASGGSDVTILPRGILWSDHGGNSQDLILITNKGMELHKVSTLRVQCKLSRSVHVHDVCTFLYDVQSRLVLLISSIAGSKYLTREDCVVIRSFFLRVDRGDQLLAVELPPPEKVSKLVLDPGILSQNIQLVTIYGEPYCVIHRPCSSLAGAEDDSDSLTIYKISRDSLTATVAFVFALRSGGAEHVTFSVADNVLVCHIVDSCKIVLIDISTVDNPGRAAELEVLCISKALHVDGGDPEAMSFDHQSTTLQYLQDGWIWDEEQQMLWSIHLDLDAIVNNLKESGKPIDFLSKRGRDSTIIVVPPALLQSREAQSSSSSLSGSGNGSGNGMDIYITEQRASTRYIAKRLMIELVSSLVTERAAICSLDAIFVSLVKAHAEARRRWSGLDYFPSKPSADVFHDVLSDIKSVAINCANKPQECIPAVISGGIEDNHQNRSAIDFISIGKGVMISQPVDIGAVVSLGCSSSSAGHIICLTQTELLTHVWLPAAMGACKIAEGATSSGSTDSKDLLSYLGKALCCYVSCVSGAGEDIDNGLALLLWRILIATDQIQEACRLLREGTFPDCAFLALHILEECDSIQEADQQRLSGATTPDTTSNKYLNYNSSSPMRDIRRNALDMLWRLQEHTTYIVRWLLKRGELLKAFEVCRQESESYGSRRTCSTTNSNNNGSDSTSSDIGPLTTTISSTRNKQAGRTKTDIVRQEVDGGGKGCPLSPASIPGIEFFQACISHLERQQRIQGGYLGILSFDIFFVVLEFLKEWEPELLAKSSSTSRNSRLANQLSFPYHIFAWKAMAVAEDVKEGCLTGAVHGTKLKGSCGSYAEEMKHDYMTHADDLGAIQEKVKKLFGYSR